jgi:hypothetical protein
LTEVPEYASLHSFCSLCGCSFSFWFADIKLKSRAGTWEAETGEAPACRDRYCMLLKY